MTSAIKTLDEIGARIESQQQKLAQLKERKKKLEDALRARENKAKRTTDTRRKILAGAVLLNAVSLGKVSENFVSQLLDAALEKQTDRDLFQLPPVHGNGPAIGDSK